MAEVWVYSVAASKNPDDIECVVPWMVDETLIFFGPCKMRMRERLRRQFLGNGKNHVPVNDQLFIVGVNGANPHRERKVVWWGRVSEVMTFCGADQRLTGNRFHKLRNHPASPLHLRPIFESQSLVGYEHVSDEHIEKDAWVSDLVSNSARRSVRIDERTIMLDGRNPWETFDRDCCMLLENRFFAQGEGIRFDDKAVKLLREAQPRKRRKDIDSYAVFGLTENNRANGLRGTWLAIDGTLADRFIAWLEDQTNQPRLTERSGNYGTAKTYCF